MTDAPAPLRPYTEAELARQKAANLTLDVIATAFCVICLQPITNEATTLVPDKGRAHAFCPGALERGHPCVLIDPAYLEICGDPDGIPAGAHECEVDGQWDAAGLVMIHAETGQPLDPSDPAWIGAPAEAVCHACVGDILDCNVACAPCGLTHLHMSECTNLSPHVCSACGSPHWTAAAVVAHTLGHTLNANRIYKPLAGRVLPITDPETGKTVATIEATDAKPILDVDAWPEVERGVHFAPPTDNPPDA